MAKNNKTYDPFAILHEIPKKEWFKKLSYEEWVAFMEKLCNAIEDAGKRIEPLLEQNRKLIEKIKGEGDKELNKGVNDDGKYGIS
jgi:hypothetical protein